MLVHFIENIVKLFRWLHRPISLLDTVGNQLSRPSEGRAVRVPTRAQLARLVERVKRNFREKRLTGAVFLDVTKAFDSIWIEGCAIWLWNMVSYIKGGTQAKIILKRDLEENIWSKVGWEWGVQKPQQWETS